LDAECSMRANFDVDIYVSFYTFHAMKTLIPR
jgi:hypothetical protein